jgi:hypothetical protein
MPTRIHLKDGQSLLVAEEIPNLDRAAGTLRATRLESGEPVAVVRADVERLNWEPG